MDLQVNEFSFTRSTVRNRRTSSTVSVEIGRPCPVRGLLPVHCALTEPHGDSLLGQGSYAHDPGCPSGHHGRHVARIYRVSGQSRSEEHTSELQSHSFI